MNTIQSGIGKARGTFPRAVDDGVTKAPERDDDEIDLLALLSTIWRGKWLIAFVFMLSVLAGGYYAFFAAVPLYRATTTVIFEGDDGGSISGLDSVLGGGQASPAKITSELEVMRARGLMGKVVDRLDLSKDPEFNTSLRTPGYVDRVKGQISSALASLMPSANVPQTDPEADADRTRAVTSLLEKVSVGSVRDSLVFNISATTEDRHKSALIADTIAELYVLDQIEVKFDKMQQATEWLSERVVELQGEVEAADEAVSSFSAQTDLVSVEGLRGLERQLKDTRDRMVSLREARNAAERRLAALNAAETRAQQAEAAGDTELSRLLSRVTAGRPETELAFDLQFERVVDRTRADLQRSTQQLEAVIQAEASLSAQIESQSRDLIQLQQLTRVAEATRLLYEHFLTRLKETSAQQGIQQADSRVLSSAVVPEHPSFPRKSLVLALSGVLGVMFGIALVLLRELRKTGFRTSDDLERHTGVVVMGQVPVIPGSKRRDILSYMKDKPTSAAMEAVRNLRTSLLLSNVDNPPQVIVSTSSIPGEGKTTNAIALAYNFIGLGKKVLLIEGDIRRRTLNEYFEGGGKHGLVSLLGGERSVDEVIFRPDAFEADVILGDKSRTNAADLFSSERFREFMAQMRTQYDIIIIDTPPVLVVPDARIIAQQADALLFSVRWDSTSHAQVTEAMRQLQTSNIRPTGLILSLISPQGMKRYGYGGRYGAYGGYGGKYYEA
ncbi:succinoglycan biosynthesis transport protein ExoP [Roseovarius sp. MBR-79]|jgi:capsular exopolysaccharide synthesis family protein